MTIELDKLAYSAEEFAAVVGLSPAAVRKEIKAGKIAARFYGTKAIIPREEGKRWIESLPAEKASA